MCICVVNHVPSRYRDVRHHILPKSWGGPDVAENIAAICSTTHENIHDILNQCVRLGAWPDWAFLQPFNNYTRFLAQVAWSARPSDKPPYTTASG